MSTPSTDPKNSNPLNCSEVSAACPVEASIYGYYPNLPATCFFVAIFSICLIGNVVFGVRYGKATATYTLAMILASVAAIVGNAGRIPLHYNPYSTLGFEMQICCLTISPAFNSAAIYLTLKHIVQRFGQEWSRVRPKFYPWGFITADVIALIFQGSGGAIAATSGNNTSLLNVGTNLMLAGIVTQVVTLLVFGVMIGDYVFRRYKSTAPLSDEASATISDTKFRIFAGSLPIIYIAVFTRCVYRIAEMAKGWSNPLMQNELIFLILDSTMVAVATILQTFVHPGVCFPLLEQTRAENGEKSLSDSSKEEIV